MPNQARAHLKLMAQVDPQPKEAKNSSIQSPIESQSSKGRAFLSEFYIHAILQAARGYQLGLDLDSAKSWGLNRAIFYRAAKNGYFKRGKKALSHDQGNPSFHLKGGQFSKHKNFGILYPVG